MLNVHVPDKTQVKSYVIKVQDRSTRKVVFLSGLQKVASGRDLSAQPLRVAMPFNQRGSFLVQVLAANVDNVEALPQQGVSEPQLFFAKILDVSTVQELDVPLLPVAPEFDSDGDHFPDAVRWLAALPEAQAMYKDTPEVLDCVDGDPPPTDILPKLTRGFDIHPLAQPQCSVSLRPAHAPTATVLPPFAPLDTSCAGQPRICADKDGDGDFEGSDCDDSDATRFHGNPRPRNCCTCSDPKSCATDHSKINMALCNPKRCDTTYDYNCTGLSVPCFTDDDCDGYSPNDPDIKLRDCDDTDPNVNPGITTAQKKSHCDPADGIVKDWACDGRPLVVCVPCDQDGDGFQRDDGVGGTCPTANYKASHMKNGKVIVDCDDTDRGVFPGAVTAQGTATKLPALDPTTRRYNLVSAMRGLCRNLDARGQAEDTDCALQVGGAVRIGCPTAACDADGDGYANNTPGCLLAGEVADCNDNDPQTFPGAPLYCKDGKDHDCDGAADLCSVDRDGDGYPASVDCNDTNSAVHPFATEICNGADDDCDGLVDEQNPGPTGPSFRLIQNSNDATGTNTQSCADYGKGSCAATTHGFLSGHCVCTGIIPTSTPNSDAIACPGYDKAANFTARCFGAIQPQKQTCNADLPATDDDCDGNFDDPTGKNLQELGNTCGVTVAGTPCVKGTVAGCNRQLDNPFFTAKAQGFLSRDRFLVCKGQSDPRPEICNGFDDNCDGSLDVANGEKDTDGDTFLACQSCAYDAANPWSFNTTVYSYCKDCDDTLASGNRTYPKNPIPMGKYPNGAPELCDGIDNKCISGDPKATQPNDGNEDCGVLQTGLPMCCPALAQCINPLTDKNHCGDCTTKCNDPTIEDSCSGGHCACGSDLACDPTSLTKAVCQPGKSCVQCLSRNDCARFPTTLACRAADHTCVECTGDSDCTGNAAGRICDTTANRCVPCLPVAAGCLAGQVCKPGATSLTNSCVQCTADAHCSGGTPVCDLALNTCVPCLPAAKGCTTPNVCKSGATTAMNSCVQCQVSADCKTAPLLTCNATTNTCVPCLLNADCGAGKVCLLDAGGDASKNSCVQCQANADCAAVAGKPICDPTLHKCVVCDASADCTGVAGKPACYVNADPNQNLCVACLTKTDCATVAGKPGCFLGATPATNQCVPCAANSDCTLATPTCKMVANPANNLCLVCLASADCPMAKPVCIKDAGMVDANNVCSACATNADCKVAASPKCKVVAADMSMNSCVPCLASADCNGTTPACNTTTNQCVECGADGDCKGANKKCLMTTNMCVECLANADCPMGKPTCNTLTNVCM